MLKDILTYHVVGGEMMAADVTTKQELDGWNEKVIKVTSKGDAWMVGGATITTTDIKCSNGVVHVIDGVMMPPAKKGKAKNSEMVTKTVENTTVTETKTTEKTK